MNNSDLHILIVDDVLENLRITAQILRESGYKLSLAEDGRSALKILETDIPDLILLDIMMPGMDGLELCRIIKKNELLKEIPVIFITAFNQSDDLVKGFKSGGVDYITKPYNRDELLIRVKTHLDLSISRKKLIETIKTRDKLYSIIAHDIRTPFSLITTLINSINEGYVQPGSDNFKEIMKDLEKSANDTNSLINNLLEWTRLQSGAITLNPRSMKIVPVLDDCIQLLSGSAKNKKIEIVTAYNNDPFAFFDEITVHTVFRNIISNAIKFTPENGLIHIETRENKKNISVIIKDTGIGFSEEALHKIFDKKEHFTSYGTKNEEGTGLGLHLVREMVGQNMGEINIKSLKGEGTTITINLPKINKV